MNTNLRHHFGLAVTVAALVATAGCAGAAGGAGASVLFGALALLTFLAGCTSSHGVDGPDTDDDGYPDVIDCRPEDPSIHPEAVDECEPSCDGGGAVDQDCDGVFDEDGCMVALNCFYDADGDGYGDGFGPGPDCDDSDPTVHPDAEEIPCDGVDQDCDGLDDPADFVGSCIDDADMDGYPSGLDCDDEDPSVHPGAEEICCDGVDSDCDGSDAPEMVACNCFYDEDGDGYGEGFGPGPDCDDTDPTIHPGATETACDGVDSDCDGEDNPDGAPMCVMP